MDPLTIVGAVASCAQLAEMTGKTFVHLFRYYHGVKQAPEKSKELTDEISELSSVLEDLADTLKEVNDTCGDVVNDIIKARSLQRYSDFLNDFQSRIHVDKKDLKKRVKWPFSAKENEESISRIERYKATFVMALETANLKLTSINTYVFLFII
jgi:predicted ribosome quality control (RQC) complex YloA/Tae2 family protein